MSSLWDDLILDDEKNMIPKEYLEEQSELLKKKTGYCLFLEVKQYEKPVYEYPEEYLMGLELELQPKLVRGEEISYENDDLSFKVSLKSESINYEYIILKYSHSIFGYPVNIEVNPDIVVTRDYKVQDFYEFQEYMKEIFLSDKVTQVIKSMYSLSK